MTAHFPLAPSSEWGYDPAAVDPVIDIARHQFANPASHVLDASTLRTSQFGLVKGGYVIGAVDTALDRLDDAFAQQEANRILAKNGHEGARQVLDDLKTTLVARASRGHRKAFKRQPWWLKGYSVRQVDNLIKGVAAAINSKASAETGLTIGALRTHTFAPKWAGYNEAQVDAFIDRTVQYLQISKHLG